MTAYAHISTTLMVSEFVVLLTALLLGFRLERIHPITKLNYLLWISTVSTSNLYYLMHNLQNKGLYLPFSVMDVVDIGIYVLLPAALQNHFSISLKKWTPAGTAGALFGAVNIWLWILWSGKWLGNLMNAVPFIYLMFICARSLQESGAFTRTEAVFLLSALTVAMISESILYFMTGTVYMVLDILGYIVLFSCTLYFIFKTVDALKRGSGDKAFALSASSYAMSAVTGYLSYEPIYFVAEGMVILSMLFTYLALRKRDREAVT